MAKISMQRACPDSVRYPSMSRSASVLYEDRLQAGSTPTHSPLLLGCKRFSDLIIAASLLFSFLPLMLLLSILISLDSGGFPIYRQLRKGRHGKTFHIYKFRTMVPDAHRQRSALVAKYARNDIIFKFRNDPRLIRIGRFLRRYSLDELPQLFNVIRGEMSLVGPRPFSLEVFDRLPSEHPQYNRWVIERHCMLPGMTGLWQVNGRSDLPPAELIRLDLEYVNNWTPLLDLVIFCRTIPVVINSKGAY